MLWTQLTTSGARATLKNKLIIYSRLAYRPDINKNRHKPSPSRQPNTVSVQKSNQPVKRYEAQAAFWIFIGALTTPETTHPLVLFKNGINEWHLREESLPFTGKRRYKSQRVREDRRATLRVERDVVCQKNTKESLWIHCDCGYVWIIFSYTFITRVYISYIKKKFFFILTHFYFIRI